MDIAWHEGGRLESEVIQRVPLVIDERLQTCLYCCVFP